MNLAKDLFLALIFIVILVNYVLLYRKMIKEICEEKNISFKFNAFKRRYGVTASAFFFKYTASGRCDIYYHDKS